MLLENNHWARFDWTAFEKSNLFQRIPDSTEPSVSKDGSLHWIKERDVTIGGYAASEKIQYKLKDNQRQYRYLIQFSEKQAPPKLCNMLLAKLRHEYGGPSFINDLSRVGFAETESGKQFVKPETADIKADWRIGKTHIRLDCLGWDFDKSLQHGLTSDRGELINILFSNLDTATVLAPVFWITCAYDTTLFTEAKQLRGKSATITFGFDPNKGKLLRIGNAEMGETIRYEEKMVVARVKTKSLIYEITIDAESQKLTMLTFGTDKDKTPKSRHDGDCKYN